MSSAAAAAATAIALCEVKQSDGSVCNKPATQHYRWDWGAEGNSCPACVPLLHQSAASLSRTFHLAPLPTTSVDSGVSRGERTQLIAAKLAAEAELEEVQQRGHSLYNSNVDLTKQVQALKMRETEHLATIAQQEEQLGQLAAKLEQRDRDAAETSTELQRLRTLVQFAEAPPPKTAPSSAKGKGQQPAGG